MYILKLLKTNKLKSYVQKQILLATYKFVLCSENRIEGAIRIGYLWAIQANAKKPKDARIKSEKYRKNKSDDE